MKNLGQLMKQAQQMQQKMAEMQAELESVEMDLREVIDRAHWPRVVGLAHEALVVLRR